MGKSEAYMLPANWSADFAGHQRSLTVLNELLMGMPEPENETTG